VRAKVEIDWISADDTEGLLAEGRLHGLDGIVVPGGFGIRGIEGKIAAAGYAREEGVPISASASASTARSSSSRATSAAWPERTLRSSTPTVPTR